MEATEHKPDPTEVNVELDYSVESQLRILDHLYKFKGHIEQCQNVEAIPLFDAATDFDKKRRHFISKEGFFVV